ncbi:MAG: glycerol kinase GlpK [Propionibacteriaceae bacterium]|jgi:glycerol kinase|nr:glycerol kinase GlpK [Propionibacteriaceae bacterium]
MVGYILAIDQGTTSNRAAIFDHDHNLVAMSQQEHDCIFPKPGWVEQDAELILANTIAVIHEVMAKARLSPADLAGIGIDNQTETTVIWDKATGKPIYHAIVWQDSRGQELIDSYLTASTRERVSAITRLPCMSYLSMSKILWLLANIPNARERAAAGELCMGSMDSWLTWNLTGGPNGGVHVTDPSNASRMLLMDMEKLEWSQEVAAIFEVPLQLMPKIVPSGEVVGTGIAAAGIAGVPLAARIGDQQAAAFGQACFEPGSVKCTYGTGTFLIANTGTDIVSSTAGLLTTVIYQIGEGPACYGLEGSVAVTGSLIQWLRDSLQLIEHSAESETLANSVRDNAGVYLVPAFSGLYAPRWRYDARGTIVGLTRYATKAHLARAALEACAFQTGELIDAITTDWNRRPLELKVDGGMTANSFLMQIQADLLDMPVVLPAQPEATVAGVASAAGLAVGIWSGIEELAASWTESRRWTPTMDTDVRQALWRDWNRAVERSLGWAEEAAPQE